MAELTEQEQKYFESGGTAEITETPESVVEPEKPETPEPVKVEVTPEPKVETPPPPKMVDKRALDEARISNRELRAKYAQIEAAHQQAMKKLEEFQQRIDPNNQKPAFEDNPAEHLRHEVTQTRQELADLKAKQDAEAKIGQFTQWYSGQAQSFAAQQKDFFDAYATYNRDRVEQLINLGLTDEQATQRLRYEEMQLASTAVQLGQNPAQLIYQLAQSRGYKPAELQGVQNQSTVPTPANGKLEQIRKGMEASKPLSSIGGGGQVDNLTWEYVASAPDDEFLALWNKMEKAEQPRR